MKIKIIKRLYGGDAKNKKELSIGDCLTIPLIEEAVTLLLKERKNMDYFNTGDLLQKFDITIPTSQLKYLRMKDCSLMFYRFFSCVPIHQYKTNERLQKTIIKSGTKQVNIYTTRE